MGALLLCLLGAMTYFLYRLYKTPILTIEDNSIKVATFFTKQMVNDVKNTTLVLGTDYLAFREKDKKEITIAEDQLSKQDWIEVLNDLQALPFESVSK